MRVSVLASLAVIAVVCYLSMASADPEPSRGWGWQPQGWGWRPAVRYLNFKVPIPRIHLPRIRLGVHAGFKASVGHGRGWGWGW